MTPAEQEEYMALKRAARKDKQNLTKQRNVAIVAGIIGTVGAAVGGYAAGGGFYAAVKEGTKGLGAALQTYEAGPSQSPESAGALSTQPAPRQEGAAAGAAQLRQESKERRGETGGFPMWLIVAAIVAFLVLKK